MKFTSNPRSYFYVSLFFIIVGIIFALAYGPQYGGVLPLLFGGACGLVGCFLNKVYRKKPA